MGSDLETELDRALSDGPFHLALSLAVQRPGLGLGRLQCRLAERGIKISTATLSYWSTGRSQPEREGSLHGVAVLEELLRLPPGALVGLLRSPRVRSRGPRSRNMDLGLWPSIVDVVEDFEMPVRSVLRPLSIDNHVTIGANGSVRQGRVRMTLRSLADGVTRKVMAWCPEKPVSGPPRLVDLAGCRRGGVRWDPATGQFSAELLFGRPLAEGETTMIEYTVVPPTDMGPETRLGQVVLELLPLYTLHISFAPGAVPARCVAFHQATASAPEEELRELLPDDIPSVCIAVTDARPGVYGIRLDW
ncbi:hypothetical protein Lfu02_77890 [Longispora fulva]|uniref:Uncharacterized protein n=1 Tax=Longispora fulva TaxID=619741 RepID=A0A8J7KK44_9ACTN|nr:hypothetical protein [Longispora fulva]MBG6136236.1 hypothetical protein [Longispora fulva]GIG63417.1 hypothetical protein Lfu02_77890 [Longispora fulva]